jgi:methylenetetrahydrofolate--tRNA-(uracil-5-)-methyltransferase
MQKKLNKTDYVTVIGAGLAGSEAAFQLAGRGISVYFHEMRPEKTTPVHETSLPAELVCSNSLGSDSPDSAPGLLKYEMRKLNSLIMQAADNTRVPAGQALAVDRLKFSQYIQDKLSSFSNIKIINKEVTDIPENGLVIIATGPLTSDSLADQLKNLLGSNFFFFFDAVSPVIMADSINRDIAFEASRYGKGTADYLNCPMNRDQYDAFYNELVNAERIEVKDFEKKHLFEGCMPIEEMADRGRETLLFGPLKPVGLDESATAVVQLRKENREGTMYSLVGFQTRLKWGEQKRVLRMIPGLENAEFARYGVMHKNIYIDSPRVLQATLQLKKEPRLLMAGQITGVEGYMESAAMGLVAGLNAHKLFENQEPIIFPGETAIGSLLDHITDTEIKHFQPMNINFGVLPPAVTRGKKKDRRKIILDQAREKLEDWIKTKGIFIQ